MQGIMEVGRGGWIEELKNKAEELKKKGANLQEIKSWLSSNCEFERLLSIDSELSSLELLDKIHDIKNFCYEAPEDLTFPEEKISYSVKTATLKTETSKKILRIADYLEKEFSKDGYLVQIIFGDELFSGRQPFIIKEKLGDGVVKSVTEIMISLIPFQKETNKIILARVRKAERDFTKKGYCDTRIAIVDLRHIPYDFKTVINFLKTNIEHVKLDGVLLLVYDVTKENHFFFIGQYNSDGLYDKYKKIATNTPLSAEWLYTIPTKIQTEEPGNYTILHREKDGTLIINGKRVRKSLTADEKIMITGLRESPEGIKSLTFGIDEKETEIHFK